MKVNPIPEEYLWKNNARSHSPVEQSIRDLSIEHITCPCCGAAALHTHMYDDTYVSEEPLYRIECDLCGWESPSERLSDVGEVIAEFKSWYAAWTLMGKPGAFVNSDCNRFFNPNENELLKNIANDDDAMKAGEEIRLINNIRVAIYEARTRLGESRYKELISNSGLPDDVELLS